MSDKTLVKKILRTVSTGRLQISMKRIHFHTGGKTIIKLSLDRDSWDSQCSHDPDE